MSLILVDNSLYIVFYYRVESSNTINNNTPIVFYYIGMPLKNHSVITIDTELYFGLYIKKMEEDRSITGQVEKTLKDGGIQRVSETKLREVCRKNGWPLPEMLKERGIEA